MLSSFLQDGSLSAFLGTGQEPKAAGQSHPEPVRNLLDAFFNSSNCGVYQFQAAAKLEPLLFPKNHNAGSTLLEIGHNSLASQLKQTGQLKCTAVLDWWNRHKESIDSDSLNRHSDDIRTILAKNAKQNS